MAEAPFSVHGLGEIRLPWAVRRRIRKLKRVGRSGIVLGALMAPTRRRITSLRPAVFLSGPGFRLSLYSWENRRTTVVRLPAGSYRVALRASRTRSVSEFDYDIELADGDVFVAVSRPIQPWTLFGANPESDEWYLGSR